MLSINEEINKTANIMVEIKPQKKDELGKWIENKSYKLELLGGEKRTITPKSGSEPFDMASYTFNIINADGSKTKGIYEIAIKSKKGDINYIIKRMIELQLNVGDVILLGTDENGFISISKLNADGIESTEEIPSIDIDEIPVIEDNNGTKDDVNVADIPF
jgi:hypothetical protein